MEVMSVIATGIAGGCIAIATGICIWCALGNVDKLIKNADRLEDGD